MPKLQVIICQMQQTW